MKLDLSIAMTTGLFSATWIVLATLLHLPAWAGFLGCTTYFAINNNSSSALFICALSLASGVAWACASLGVLQQYHGSLLILVVSTGTIAFFMCIQARLKYLSFIPGAFIGSCTVFASDVHLISSIAALFAGLLAGFLMKFSGLWLHKLTSAGRSVM
ncbi:DUF1097 domain-containing protein [Klebsiella quasipneumoniae]|uniref:DUF1097 domain-containing protein n=1 Tax=Klebsiella quasipneumoniae TaxID=1463165 RepID=UPI003B429DCF